MLKRMGEVRFYKTTANQFHSNQLNAIFLDKYRGKTSMERNLGTFGLADFFAQRRRKKPVALDAINAMISWGRIEKLLRKKFGRSDEPKGGASNYPASCSRCCCFRRCTI